MDITKEMLPGILSDGGGITISPGESVCAKASVTDGGEINGHTYHPAFRQLVEGEACEKIAGDRG
ncbi:MAG: hypothetical protein V8Q42_09030 [Anaerovoracaceae bacterium]